MATILNIETSGNICSVAVSKDGMIEYQLEDLNPMNHAKRLAPFIEKCFDETVRREMPLDAVSVSIGPGSYTGLRIGLSTAKGVCFGKNIPLITVPTLEILAVKAMFRSMEWTGDEILVPMIDARRMEVYTAAYDFALNKIIQPQPLILDDTSYSELPTDRKIIFIGSGTTKAKDVVKHPGAEWIDGLEPHARDMTELKKKFFRENRFADVAYSTPEYLKEFQASTPKNKL